MVVVVFFVVVAVVVAASSSLTPELVGASGEFDTPTVGVYLISHLAAQTLETPLRR